MSWQDSFTAPGSWTDPFGATAGRSRPHRGTDLARLTLYAWENLKVLDSDPTYSALGHIMLLQADDGMRFGVSHARKGTRAANGRVMKPGGTLAVAANGPTSLPMSNVNFPGLEWAGRHFHITMSRTDPFGASGLLDARPRILACASGKPIPAPGGSGSASWAFNKPSAAVQKRVQAALKKRGRYSGPVDGVWGVNSIKGVQTTIRNVGYKGPIDGIPGERTCHFVQVYAQRFGDYKGPVDSILGPNTWAGFALGLERP